MIAKGTSGLDQAGVQIELVESQPFPRPIFVHASFHSDSRFRRAPSSQSRSFLASTLVEIVFISSTAKFGGHFTQIYSLLAFTIPVNKPRNWIQSKTPA